VPKSPKFVKRPGKIIEKPFADEGDK